MSSCNRSHRDHAIRMKACALPLALALLLAGCSNMYYGAMESIGIPKRELLVDRVEEARDTQEEAKEQFSDALEQFMSVVRVESSELETTYRKLKGELEAAESKASAVKSRIESVESVGDALFKEWRAELEEYSNADLRARSAIRLRETRAEYENLLAAMWRAERKIGPVLTAMNDQVLYLKHNLNARAIASLRDELRVVESDVSALIAEMQTSIDEANRFLADFDGTQVEP